MKYEDVRDLLTALKTNYPQSFIYYDESSGQMLLDIWYQGLKDFPKPVVTKAVADIMLNDPREYAPNVAQVRKKILQMHTNDSDAEALEAWQTVKKWLRNMNHDASDGERYMQLPETIRFIYKLPDLRIMGEINRPEYNDNYEKPRFLKLYKQLKETEELRIMDGGELPLLVQQAGTAMISNE